MGIIVLFFLILFTGIIGTDKSGKTSLAGTWIVNKTWLDGYPICLLWQIIYIVL